MCLPPPPAGPAEPGVSPPPRPCPERRLVEVFARLQPQLGLSLATLLGNEEDARDALQTAFVKCWQARAGLDGVQDLPSWVWRIAVNVARDLQRNAWRRRICPLEPEQVCRAEEGRASCPVRGVLEREERQRLRDAVEGLRPGDRDVFVLRQQGELTYEEIAERLGRPVGTVKTQMRSALQKLRDSLQAAS